MILIDSQVQIARLIIDFNKIAQISVELVRNLLNFSRFKFFWEEAAPLRPLRLCVCQTDVSHIVNPYNIIAWSGAASLTIFSRYADVLVSINCENNKFI